MAWAPRPHPSAPPKQGRDPGVWVLLRQGCTPSSKSLHPCRAGGSLGVQHRHTGCSTGHVGCSTKHVGCSSEHMGCSSEHAGAAQTMRGAGPSTGGAALSIGGCSTEHRGVQGHTHGEQHQVHTVQHRAPKGAGPNTSAGGWWVQPQLRGTAPKSQGAAPSKRGAGLNTRGAAPSTQGCWGMSRRGCLSEMPPGERAQRGDPRGGVSNAEGAGSRSALNGHGDWERSLRTGREQISLLSSRSTRMKTWKSFPSA